MAHELTITPAWLEEIADLSVVSPGVAVTRPLADLVEATLTEASGDSQHTARAYQTAIGLFLQFLGTRLGDRLPADWQPLATRTRQGKRTVWELRGASGVLRAVAAGVIADFEAWRRSEGDSRSTVNLRRNAVNTFLRVAYREGVLTHEQAQNMGLTPYRKRESRDEQPVGRRLTREEVRKLREIVLLRAGSDCKADRDRAVLDCMLFAGLRRSEVAALRAGSLKQDSGRWWLVVTGKGEKTRRVKCHDMLYKSLAAWAKRAGLALGAGESYLFCGVAKGGQPTGCKLHPGVIGRIVAEYGRLAGLGPERLSAHDLRRTCARNAFDNGAGLPQIQDMLGHADIKTTMRYIGALEDDTNTAVDYVNY